MSEKLLYVGLDHDVKGQNLDLASDLANSDAEGKFGFKVNLDHALIWGQDYIQRVVDTDKPVFVDLKMNNGSRTMSNVVKWLGDMGIAHTNIWAHAESNLAATVSEVTNVENRPAILGVTFYTRWNEQYAQTHHHMSLDELISHWSHVAVDNGADGIILPGNYLPSVDDIDTVKLTPGVRIGHEETKSRQVQVTDPYDAIRRGADILVVGSPIHGAVEPVRALQRYLDEIKRAQDDMHLAVK